MRKVLDYLSASPVRFFFLAAIIAFFVLWYVNEHEDPEGFSWHDVIVGVDEDTNPNKKSRLHWKQA